jgi:hypothetical protein
VHGDVDDLTAGESADDGVRCAGRGDRRVVGPAMHEDLQSIAHLGARRNVDGGQHHTVEIVTQDEGLATGFDHGKHLHLADGEHDRPILPGRASCDEGGRAAEAAAGR